MKQVRIIVELVKELGRQRLARKDFITDTRGGSTLTLDMGKTLKKTTLSDLAHFQIAARIF